MPLSLSNSLLLLHHLLMEDYLSLALAYIHRAVCSTTLCKHFPPSELILLRALAKSTHWGADSGSSCVAGD